MRALSIFLLLLSAVFAEETHWAYEPPEAAAIPENDHPVDALLEEGWKREGLEPAPMTAPRQWLKRAAYTLTGLPPTPAQLERLEGSPDEATWRALVDELLADPAYGERWARHWMDVARYADTRGYNFDKDNRYPFAYTYRDWLIRAFNEDMPYPRFAKLQIAADRMTESPDDPDLAALGFLTVGRRGGRVETIDDRVDVVTRGFLSTTVACARCHDHKTDPIPTEDYYSLYSIFDNATEPREKPVIGEPEDGAAYEDYQRKIAELEKADRAARQKLVDHIRSPETLPDYLHLAWRAKTEEWDHAKATSEGFNRGGLRAKALLRWRDFLNKHAWGDDATPRLAEWAAAVDAADDEAAREAASAALADDWLAASGEAPLAVLAKKRGCPLSYGVDRIHEFMNVEDHNERRQRESEMSRLMAEHPGSPPRAMSLRDKDDWSPAAVFKRGDPANRGEPFERHWLGFLGGGAFEDGVSPRLSLARKIADLDNPLTARVIVNRVWAWHFGEPLANPGDFGPQTPVPGLLPLLDTLAVRFRESGGSLKDLHRLLLTSKAFRRAADGPAANDAIDEANRHFWRWNRRRLDFESMRDRVLAAGGSLETGRVGGRSVRLENPASDARRSVYAFIDRYELPNTFISFDLPHPDHHSPGRVQTTVPQQALYFLNGPLVLRQAARLAKSESFTSLPDAEARIRFLYQRLYRRAPSPEEIRMLREWIASAEPAEYAPPLGGYWQVRHAPDDGRPVTHPETFPVFADGVWKTGPDPSEAPIRWLNVGRDGGHAAAGHAMILRWRATGAGRVRMAGDLRRTQEGGAALAWRIDGRGEIQTEGRLEPESETKLEGEWTEVEPGDTLDFVLRAPEGDACGGVAWTLRVEGREDPSRPVEEIGDFTAGFPTSNGPPDARPNRDPWADLIQTLMASNEFHHID